jgi:hypothetical protein
MTNSINTQFNTIETIYNQNPNNSDAYMAAMDMFEQQASIYANNDSFVSRKSAEEVSLAYDKAKHTTESYTIYALAHAAEKWLEKAWNNAD